MAELFLLKGVYAIFVHWGLLLHRARPAEFKKEGIDSMPKGVFSKRLVLTILFVVLLLCQAALTALADEPQNGEVILKLDRPDVLQLPKDFRTSNDAFAKPGKGKMPVLMPSRVGMDKLNISGSSTFSQLELAKMLTQLPADRLIIVDLRLESHGYLDGMAVSWYGAFNRANVGKSPAEVETMERELLYQTLLGPVKVARLNPDKSIGSTIELNVTHALTEAEVTNLFGVKYFRVQSPDYVKPTDENVDQFLAFYKKLPKDAWLHFHCHAGEGRTTVFMAMTDMLRNAQQVSYEDIMTRQWLIGGQDIRTATSADPWKKEVYAERAQFTRDFYDYVTQRANETITWTEWAKQHK